MPEGFGLTPLHKSCWCLSAPAVEERQTADPVLAELFRIARQDFNSINLRFHPYPPKDFAVGGHLLSERVPIIGIVRKRMPG